MIQMEKMRSAKRITLPLINLAIIFITAIFLYYISALYVSLSLAALLFDTLVLAVFIIAFQVLIGSKNIWRYAGPKEYLMMCLYSFIGFLFYFLISKYVYDTQVLTFFMLSVTTCSLLVAYVMHLFYRGFQSKIFADRQTKKKARIVNNQEDSRYIIIIGAGDAGVALLNEIERTPNSPYKVWSFFDDNEEKIGKRINGVRVDGPIDTLPKKIKFTPVHEVVFAIPSMDLVKRKKIVEMCSSLDCHLKILPDTMMIMERSDLSLSNYIRDIQIEDLLGRPVVDLDRSELLGFLSNQVVLVTGGGGSIGSELCRQIASYQPKELIIFDVNENTTYELLQELNLLFNGKVKIQLEIGTIRDKKRVDELFALYRPDLVFHAAAHKHVPLMEANPAEAVKNNIFGTYNLLMAAKEYQCAKFVMISTDKAVNPTSVMGATKRFCEIMVQSMASHDNCSTDYVAVRFGNVLGSNGSVIPLFKKQIVHGGPLTITDKRITRYFMTISEAASLVLHAGNMADDSEVYVLDMGEPIKILDLAENLIRLSGYTPYKDIDIKEIGLRPGEKLYEELLRPDELHDKTTNKKIFIERQNQKYCFVDIVKDLDSLEAAISDVENQKVIELLRELVPSYKDAEEYNVIVEEN